MNSLMSNGILGMPECRGGRGHGNSKRSHQRPRGRGKGKFAPEKETEPIPEDLVDPCKVFVSNLRPQVTETVLRDILSTFAAVERVTIIKDKQSRKSKGYGFVKVKTQEDVEKLLALHEADRYLHGRVLVIRQARKKISLPGDDGYVRCPLPEREFDLSQPDPTEPSIHMLVDDVMFKIFSYLPVKSLVRCEGVCRRWQMMVHRHFTTMTTLDFSEDSLYRELPLTKPVVSKLLILSGPHLKSLKVQKIDLPAKINILKVIGQLCPMLEHLDISKAQGIDFAHISKLAAGCKYIKSFNAQSCIDFNEKTLHQLLISYPELERLNVAGTSVYGKNFHLLPSTLKELSIERIPDLCHKSKKITEIADKCPNIEILEMRECMISRKDLVYFGEHCHNLTKLSLYLPNIDTTDALASFKNLKDLTLVGDVMDLSGLFKSLLKMEMLSIESRDIVSEADFSLLENLKSLKLTQTLLTEASLLTVSKCKQLEEFYLYKGFSPSSEVLVSILKGCPKLKKLACPNMSLSPTFIKRVDEVMKGRTGKLLIVIRNCMPDTEDVQYDKNKIEFDFSHDFSLLYDPFSYDTDDSDYSDVSFNDLYDSDVDFADHYFFNDEFHDDLFDAAAMLAAWNHEAFNIY